MRPLIVALALTACSAGLSDPTFPTGSSSLAVSTDRSMVYALDGDAGEIVAVDPAAGAVDRLQLGDEPARVARAGDLVFVTLRREGTVVVLAESGRGLTEQARIEVGAEPYGVVASEDGGTVYVAASMADEVVEIDVASLTIVRRFAVGGQPRWLALAPSGRALYVGAAMGGRFAHIDLQTGRVATHSAPDRMRVSAATGRETPLQVRITGDLAVSPRGRQLAVPVFYVDTTEPDPDEEMENPDGGYGNAGGDPVGRTTPALLFLDLGGDGAPALESAAVVPVVTFDPSSVIHTESDEGGLQMTADSRRSYLTSVTYGPEGLIALATMESSRAVLAVPATLARIEGGSSPFGGGREDMAMAMPFDGSGFTASPGFDLRPIETTLTVSGPRGLAFTDRATPIVDAWLAHAVQRMPYASLVDALDENLSHFSDMGFTPMTSWRSAAMPVPVGPATFDADFEAGRRLFFTAVDERMSGHGSGTACATCHFDARTDGLTWELPNGRLQTPSLAGQVSLTAPVTWLSSVPSVADEAMLTSEGRMGGEGLARADAELIARFIDSTPHPVVPAEDPQAIARGKAIFEGPAQCASCHTGQVLTDNQPHDMFDVVGVRTPTLRGLAATAPYLHDGRASTLEELVEITEAGGMGVTSHLSAADKADLVAYLRSL